MSSRLVAALALSTLGCAHIHVPGNEPGHIDARRPPESVERGKVEPPEDPGERMFVVSYGPFMGGGVATGSGQSARGAYGIGAEISAQLGTRERSHADDDFWIFPARAFGPNFGWTLASGEGKSFGPLYAELQAREIVGFGAGWAWDPDDDWHGPQGTLSFGPLYLRATHMLDGPSELHAGLLVKGSVSWISSR
jgi:hypothetical protein